MPLSMETLRSFCDNMGTQTMWATTFVRECSAKHPTNHSP